MSGNWITREGDVIPVENMTTRHLINAYLFMRRRGFVSKETVGFYISCPPPQGEMAQDAFWQEFDAICEAPVSGKLGLLERELERRGIDRFELERA